MKAEKMGDGVLLLLKSSVDLLQIVGVCSKIYHYLRFQLFGRVKASTYHILDTKILKIEIMKWLFV